MKKAISLLVACTFVLSMGVATFAADDTPGVKTRSFSTMSDIAPAAGMGRTVEDANGDPLVGINELYLVDANGNVVGVGDYVMLDPDEEYIFDIYYNDTGAILNPNQIDDVPRTDEQGQAVNGDDGKPIIDKVPVDRTPLNGATLDKGTIRLRTAKGSNAITSSRIKTIGRGATARYQMIVNTKALYGTKITEVEFELSVTNNSNIAKSTHMFEVGYETISDDDTDIGEGGYITIDNNAPIITKEQFTAIAKSVNYKTVNFEAEDGGWLFTGRVSGMGDSNFHYTYDIIPEIITKLPDQEYKFLTFNAGVTFPASGEMRIDVSDIYDAYEGNLYAYLYRNGKLTAIDHKYDNGTNEIVFRTNYLGSFVITDKAITDLNLIGEPTEPEEPEEPDDGDDTDDNTAGNGSGNPNTGAASAMNIAVALGLVSLVSAKAVSKKRK